MGITQISLNRLNKHIHHNDAILILGCQNLYDMEHYGQVADDFFLSQGYTTRMIDITGCQGARVMDLREPLPFKSEFDLVLQHGTLEHVDGGLYQPFKNIHEACKVGGIMIHENPLTGNWPLHGYHYFTEGFYTEFATACGYEILELASEASMGNDIDGWNVSCVLRKVKAGKFITEKKFNEIYSEYIFPQ